MGRPRTAAALIIGNELLTGKIQDRNIPVLARELFGLGIELRRVVICSDEVPVIVTDLDSLRSTHDLVFTSGGVGPTHDDVTMRAVAAAFDTTLERREALASLLREYFGNGLTEEHLRMADVPVGASLVSAEAVRWPTVRMDNVFVLPGLPEVFERKMPLLREHLGQDTPFVSRAVDTASDEGAIALLLEDLEKSFPGVRIGSYPRWGDGPVRVTVTFDGLDGREVEGAAAAFTAGLPSDQVVGVGDPATAEEETS
ncbi:MAG: molybdopterin-binding protein [Thermoanaerobaculia bacterium]|nr:molybdopterin-binding protein [Thermoanaerobaculia bacterium]